MLNAPFQIVMFVTDDMWCYEPLKSAVLTNHTCHWYYNYYVTRPCVICHRGSHASGVCLNGNIHTKFIVFKWLLGHDHYSLMWPTSVFVRECGRCHYATAHVPLRPLSVLLFWCPVVWVGSLLPISCSGTCGFHTRASDHWALGICPLSKGAGQVVLTCPIVICNRCHFPKIAMWMSGNIIFSNTACGSRTTTHLSLLLLQALISNKRFLIPEMRNFTICSWKNELFIFFHKSYSTYMLPGIFYSIRSEYLCSSSHLYQASTQCYHSHDELTWAEVDICGFICTIPSTLLGNYHLN